MFEKFMRIIQNNVPLYIVIVTLISGTIAFIAEQINKKLKSHGQKHKWKAGIISFLLCCLVAFVPLVLSIFYPPFTLPTDKDDIFSPTTTVQKTLLPTPNPAPTIEHESFTPDFRPGHENEFGNFEYSNNEGLLCQQDETYYLATINGIIKTENFNSFEKISDDVALHLNVVGKWLYYVGDGGIYRIRTDGQERSQLYETSNSILQMQVYDGRIYFINTIDFYLTQISTSGLGQKSLSEDQIMTFAIVDAYIYYVDMNVKYRDNDDGFEFHASSLKKMAMDGSNVETILERQEKNGRLVMDVPSDLGVYDGQLVFVNYFGLYKVDYAFNNISEINSVGGYALCIIDDSAFYSAPEPDTNGVLYQVNLKSGRGDRIGKPFEKNQQIHRLYALDNKIVFTIDRESWYIQNINNDGLKLLDI